MKELLAQLFLRIFRYRNKQIKVMRKVYLNRITGESVEVTSVRRSMFDNRWFTFVDSNGVIEDMREDEFKEYYEKDQEDEYINKWRNSLTQEQINSM